MGSTATISTEMFPWVSTITVPPCGFLLIHPVLSKYTNNNSRSPTMSSYCASPTSGMICGLANGNVLDPVALNEDESDMSPVNRPEDCYQRCLANPSCKSFFTSQWINSTSWNCDIFRNTLKNNVVSAVPGSNFFDRGCPDFLPVRQLYLFSASARRKRRTDRASLNATGQMHVFLFQQYCTLLLQPTAIYRAGLRVQHLFWKV